MGARAPAQRGSFNPARDLNGPRLLHPILLLEGPDKQPRCQPAPSQAPHDPEGQGHATASTSWASN